MALTKRVITNKTIRNTKKLLIIFTGLIVSVLLLITVSHHSTRRKQLHYDNMQNKNTSAIATKTVVACDIIEPLSANPRKINALRRTLQLAAIANHDDDCYTNHYLPYFVNYTRNRLLKKKKHLILHIPKAGGSSLCKMAKMLNKSVPLHTNCFEKNHFYPIWCCHKGFGDREDWNNNNNNTSICNTLDKALPYEITMNENYMDYPLCLNERLYSVTLREPISRVKSHEVHLLQFHNANWFGNGNVTIYQSRLKLARYNHMTWALSVGSSTSDEEKVRVVPQRQHLEIAKDTLLQLDFIIDLTSSSSQQNQLCNNVTINLLMGGIAASISLPHDNSGAMRRKRQKIRAKRTNQTFAEPSKEDYERLNALDIELYNYASKLIKLDCEFHQSILETD